MEGMMEPPPPGIVPNFPPHYPFKWQQKIMPEPHPNHLRSMGLPPSFSTPRCSNPGYGGYQYCRGYEEDQGSRDHNNGYHGSYDREGYNEEEYSNEYSHGADYGNPSDEYGAYDGDETWQGEGEWNEGGDQEYGINQGHQSHGYDPNLAPIYGAPAPAPRTKNHYYNLAPKPQSGASGSTSNGYDNNSANIPPQRSKKQEPSEGKKNHLRKVYGDRYCEGCNFGFHSLQKFQEHLESHVKCPFTGCGLETTIERLDEHLTVAHILNPAASKQIDTAEYIRQRRNNFPSVQRAQLRTALAEQQKKRGEILAIDRRWEKKEAGDKMEDNDGENNNVAASVATPISELDSCHVDSLEYEPVNWTEPPNKNHTRKPDCNVHANAKRKLMEASRQRAMVKRRKVGFHCQREGIVERVVDVLSRIPAFCGIEEYREDAQESVLASTIAQNDARQCEPSVVFHISDDEDDIPSVLVSNFPLKNIASDVAKSVSNTSHSHSTNSVKGLGGKEVSNQATGSPIVSGSALGLLLGDYGTDSEDENSKNICGPTVGDCTALLSKPAVREAQGTVMDLCDDSKSRELSATAGGTSSVAKGVDTASGFNTHSFDTDAVCGKGLSPDAVTSEKIVALKASSESEEEIVDANNFGVGECSKRRRRGKRGKKRKKSQVSGAERDLGDNHTIHNNNNSNGSLKCIKEGISYSNSEGDTLKCLRSKVVVPSLAPHLKPLNKREVDSEDERQETVPRERLPTTRWTEDKIFSYQLKGQYKKFKNNYRKSLLVKLLGDEVVRERNIILQCAKFIVQNDFFEQQKLQSMPQPKRVLVEEQTDVDDSVLKNTLLQAEPYIEASSEGVKENSIRQGEPESDGVKENTIRHGEPDSVGAKENIIRQGEPEFRSVMKENTSKRAESDREGVKENNNKQDEPDCEDVKENTFRHGEPDSDGVKENTIVHDEPDSEGVKENTMRQGEQDVCGSKNISSQTAPGMGSQIVSDSVGS